MRPVGFARAWICLFVKRLILEIRFILFRLLLRRNDAAQEITVVGVDEHPPSPQRKSLANIDGPSQGAVEHHQIGTRRPEFTLSRPYQGLMSYLNRPIGGHTRRGDSS